MEYTADQLNIPASPEPLTTYREVRIGRTLYRVTSVFKGEIDLKDALEDLTVRRVAREALSSAE